MALAIPTTEPTNPVAGDSWKWDKTLSGYPASDGWQLTYYVNGPEKITLAWGTEVTANGDVFEVRVAATKTDDLTSFGSYELIGRVTDGTDTFTPVAKTINVLANPATAVAAKSLARQMVEAHEAALLANPKMTGVVRVTVNGRTVDYGSAGEFDRALARWRLKLEIERGRDPYMKHVGRMVAS